MLQHADRVGDVDLAIAVAISPDQESLFNRWQLDRPPGGLHGWKRGSCIYQPGPELPGEVLLDIRPGFRKVVCLTDIDSQVVELVAFILPIVMKLPVAAADHRTGF